MEIVTKLDGYVIGRCYNSRGTKYYTAVNKDGTEDNHAHFRDHNSACRAVHMAIRKKIPKSNYFRSCCIRLTTDKKYKERLENHKPKDTYHNPKGMKR